MSLDRTGNGPYRLLRGFLDRHVRRFDAAVADPAAAQAGVLARVLANVQGTAFARDHDLDGVTTLAEFRARVPVGGYERLSGYVARVAAGEKGILTRSPVQQLLETSGTSGAAKWIPVTGAWSDAVAAAQVLWVLGLVREHEAMASGSALTLVSPAAKTHTPAGLPVGSNTGRMHLRQPWYVRFRYPIPYPVYCLPDPDVRLYALLRFALQADIRSITTANPTTVLLLARRLREHQEALAEDLVAGTLRQGPAAALDPDLRRSLERNLRKRSPPSDWHPARIWDLVTVNCWKGGSAGYFLPLLPPALGADLPVREVGISASETFLALSLSHTWPGCVAWPLGDFQEYVASDGSVHLLQDLVAGSTYRVVVSGTHGMYRYDLGDLVEVVGRYRATPVLRFLRRAGNVLNVTGEKVTENQVISALDRVAARLGGPARQVLIRVRLGEIPAYEAAVEAPVPSALAPLLDEALREVNVEYEEKRASGRLGTLVVRPTAREAFLGMRRLAVRAGTPEGQYKDPLLALDDATWQRLLDSEAAAPPRS